jgi:hypothetical protein
MTRSTSVFLLVSSPLPNLLQLRGVYAFTRQTPVPTATASTTMARRQGNGEEWWQWRDDLLIQSIIYHQL